MLDPAQKKQQAVAAAQRAFTDASDRQTFVPRTNHLIRPLSEMNLNRLHLARMSFDDHYASSTENYNDGGSDYQYQSTGTIVKRPSMQWGSENQAPERVHGISRLPGQYESRKASPPSALDSVSSSSYRRVRKTRSAFVVSQIFQPPNTDDVSSVAYASERSPQKNENFNSRKSMSFLRGGTEFMGEGKARERRSYYMESSARKGCPAIILPDIDRYKGRNEKGEWGAMRVSVKKHARKLSESLFGSMRKVLGRGASPGSTAIPEQHINSSRMHFRDYITPEESNNYAAPGRFGVKEKPKIKSNYVVSKAPTLHLVPSYEMIRSDVGSILEASPGMERKFSSRSMRSTASTATSGHWNSTIASRMTGHTHRDTRMSPMPDRDEGFFRAPPRRDRYNVDARRVYSALLKRLNPEDEELSDKDTIHSPPGYFMTPGIGLLPEEEGIFDRKSNRPPAAASPCSQNLFQSLICP